MDHAELVAKVEQWLNDVSTALHRLSREREVLRETRTQLMMGVLSATQAEANLSRLLQWRDTEHSGLPSEIIARLRVGLPESTVRVL
jgi:cell division septum initiation protein DivIVA